MPVIISQNFGLSNHSRMHEAGYRPADIAAVLAEIRHDAQSRAD